MKNDTVELTVKIEIPIQTLKYLFDICNKSESTECNDSVITIKPNNITIIPETVPDNMRPQSNTNCTPSYKLYDTNPELFLEVYNRYINNELSGNEAADLLGCSFPTFGNMVKYYRDKENLHEKKPHRSGKLPKYAIYDINPKLFLEIYDKYMNDELTAIEAANLLHCSRSTFNNAVRYYRTKENLDDVKYRTKNELAKYTICDEKPKEFLEVYNKFTNKEIYSKEAARLLGMSTSTFYRSVEYYESKTRIKNFS